MNMQQVEYYDDIRLSILDGSNNNELSIYRCIFLGLKTVLMCHLERIRWIELVSIEIKKDKNSRLFYITTKFSLNDRFWEVVSIGHEKNDVIIKSLLDGLHEGM